jgi:outer membrane protein assembly factor BamB
MKRFMLTRRQWIAATAGMCAPAAEGDVKVHGKPRPLDPGAVTEDWPAFLGPRSNAISRETKLSRKLPPRILWELSKGTGYASPAIVGSRLVFLHRSANQEVVECLHPETGARIWRFTYPTAYEDRYGYNNGPRSSPVIDGDTVFTVGAEGKLHCLALDTGKLIWKRDIAADYKVPQDFFGAASTPLIQGGLLIVQVGAPGGPTVAGLDKKTGREQWRAGKEWGPSYASPIPAIIHGKPRVLVFAGGESQPPTGGLISLDPATGKIDFSYPWRSRSYESVNASCPVAFDNKVFVSASYRTGGALVEVQPDYSYKPAWKQPEFGLHFNTPIYKDGHLYGFDGRNEPDASLACVEAVSGKLVWRQMLEWEEAFLMNGSERRQMLSPYRGTLLAADSHFLCLGELGHLLWLDLTPKGCKIVSRAWLFAGRQSWALPVVCRGLLYVTQNERDLINGTGPRLLCYDLRG